MIGRKDQDQALSGEGTAIQAGRDATTTVINNNYGLQSSEVRELVELFMQSKLPALQEEAARVARANAEEFIGHFVEKLRDAGESVTHQAFTKPDAQVCFNEALRGSAEKGHEIDLDLLSKIVIGRLQADGEPLLKLVHEEAVKALPRLSKKHVLFLAYLTWMRHIRHRSITEAGELEIAAQKMLNLCGDALSISEANREYLVGVGVMNINLVADANNAPGKFKENYPFLPHLFDEWKGPCPSLHHLLDVWDKEKVMVCYLNASGKLIGLLALEVLWGKLDLKIWLN